MSYSAADFQQDMLEALGAKTPKAALAKARDVRRRTLKEVANMAREQAKRYGRNAGEQTGLFNGLRNALDHFAEDIERLVT